MIARRNSLQIMMACLFVVCQVYPLTHVFAYAKFKTRQRVLLIRFSICKLAGMDTAGQYDAFRKPAVKRAFRIFSVLLYWKSIEASRSAQSRLFEICFIHWRGVKTVSTACDYALLVCAASMVLCSGREAMWLQCIGYVAVTRCQAGRWCWDGWHFWVGLVSVVPRAQKERHRTVSEEICG